MIYPLSNNRARVLNAMFHLEATGQFLSVRTVAAAAGLSTMPTYGHLEALRELGVVDWEPGRAGTLRLLVTAEAVA